MAKEIRKYDSNYFIVIISNYAWEKHFSEDLGQTIENCGGWLIKEYMNLGAARFGNFTRVTDFQSEEMLEHTKMFHPYAFIGIPGLPPGKAFE